jgi:hypothetical protein
MRWRYAAAWGALPGLVSCGPLYDPTGPAAANRAPQIRLVSIEPAVVPVGGSATITVDAIDPDGESLFYRFTAGAGTVSVPDPARPNRAVYVHGGGAATSDLIVVKVTDTRNASATASGEVRLRVNTAPAVTVRSTGSCHPRCTVTFTAEVVDAEDDAVTYLWRGCASGTRASATCTITAPAKVTAVLSVSDGRGGISTAIAEAEGENETPVVSGGREITGAPATLAVSSSDPDGDELVCGWSGNCQCTGQRGTFNLGCDVPSGLGFCTMFFHCADPFGAAAETSFILNR